MTGARIGCLVGCTAWIVAFGMTCLVHGRFELLWPIVLPLGLASLGIGLLALLAIEASPHPATPIAGSRLKLVLGSTAVAGGLLMLLADCMLVPVLRTDEQLAGVVRAAGGVLELPRWLALAWLAVGDATLLAALRRRAGSSGGVVAGQAGDPPV